MLAIRVALLPRRGVDERPGCLETTRRAIIDAGTAPLEGRAGAVDHHSSLVEDFLFAKIVH